MDAHDEPEGTQIELEHAIGYSCLPGSLHYHPTTSELVYASGGTIGKQADSGSRMFAVRTRTLTPNSAAVPISGMRLEGSAQSDVPARARQQCFVLGNVQNGKPLAAEVYGGDLNAVRALCICRGDT